VTSREALALWLEHLAHERRSSPRTLEAYGFAARRYIAFLEQHRAEAISLASLGEITAGEVRAWLAHPSTTSSTAGWIHPTPPSPWCVGRG